MESEVFNRGMGMVVKVSLNIKNKLKEMGSMMKNLANLFSLGMCLHRNHKSAKWKVLNDNNFSFFVLI